MKVHLISVFVDDQTAALRFYTEVMGFVPRNDVPMGEHRWLTVVSPEQPDGPEVVLEPAAHPAVGPWRDALADDGIPLVSFAVADVRAEHERLSALGVTFTQAPVEMGPVVTAVLDDTCGNLVQLVSVGATG